MNNTNLYDFWNLNRICFYRQLSTVTTRDILMTRIFPLKQYISKIFYGKLVIDWRYLIISFTPHNMRLNTLESSNFDVVFSAGTLMQRNSQDDFG